MKRILLLLFLIASLGYPMMAQVVDTIDWKQETKRLNDTIKHKNKVINDLQTKLNKTKSYEADRDTAIKRYRNIQKKNGVYIDSIKGLNDTINNLRPKTVALRNKNTELENYKKQVEPLVERQLAIMATDIDQKWLNKNYAEINQDELVEELNLYEDFKDKDKGVATAYKKLTAFRDNYLLYLRGIQAINSPYESDVVSNLIQPIKDLKERERHPGRKEEVERLYVQLSDYKITVSYFQRDIIGEIDNMLKRFKQDGTHKKAWKQIKVFLDEKDNGQVVTYMMEIPWIGEQYQKYIKQLETNPYGSNSARETVMNLVP